MGYKSKIAFVFTASLLSMSSFAACFGYAGIGGPRYAGIGGAAYAGIGGAGSKDLPTTLCK